MTKRQTRLFFIISTLLFAAIFLGMTYDTHRQIATLTNEQNLTPQVIAGKKVWHAHNCINCHTMLGEGAYYAPDLTKITQQRSVEYLRAFLKDPGKFYSEERHRRLMPKLDLSDADIDNVISFMDWVAHIDNQNWPPRPILVSGGAIPGTAVSPTSGKTPETAASAASSSPVAEGEALFRASPPACFACHSVAAGVNLTGPSLAGLVTRAEKIIQSPDYKGKAKTVEAYIHESIVDPNAWLVPGPMYSADGHSFMPTDYHKQLNEQQIKQLVAYLQTLK